MGNPRNASAMGVADMAAADRLKQDEFEVELRSPDRRRKLAVVDKNGLTSMEIQEYKEVFEDFDKNKIGRISLAELGDMLTNLGKIMPSEKDLGDVMEEIDTDKSGGIDFEEFLNFMTTDRSSSRKNSDATDYSEIFDFIDDDKNGFISAEDLKKVTDKLGQKLSSLHIDEMIEDATDGGAGFISKEQFLNMMAPHLS